MKINETRESVRAESHDGSTVEVMIKAGTAYTFPEPANYKEVVVRIKDRLGDTKGRVMLSAGDMSFWSELVRMLAQHELINRDTMEYLAEL